MRPLVGSRRWWGPGDWAVAWGSLEKKLGAGGLEGWPVRRRTGVFELVRVRTARPRLQLLALDGVVVEVAVDEDVGVSAPA